MVRLRRRPVRPRRRRDARRPRSTCGRGRRCSTPSSSRTTAPGDRAPYTDADYFAHVDGKPRYDGVRDFLDLARHRPAQGAPTTATVETVAARRPQERRVQRGARARRRDGVPRLGRCCSTTCASSACRSPSCRRRSTPRRCSRPPGSPTGSATVVERRGRDRARACPASRRPTRSCTPPTVLGATAATSVVLEDAVSGVRAGAAGDFGLVVGVDRGAGAETPDRRPARRSSSRTSPSWSRPGGARMNGHAVGPGPARPRPVPDRPVGAGRDQLPARRPRRHRDAVHRRQRLPRDARQPRGGPAVVRARHLRQRLPRDLGRSGTRRRRSASPAPARRIVNVPDTKVLKIYVDDEPLTFGTADLEHYERSSRLPRRRAAPQPGLAYAVGQAGPHRLDPDGLDDPAAPRRS